MNNIVIFETDSQQAEVRLEGELQESATAKECLAVRQEGMPLRLDADALTALTLLIAESEPKSKELMARLVMNLLARGDTDKQSTTTRATAE